VSVSIDAAVRALREGEVVGMPTDTVYGLAVDPFNVEAIERLYVLKGREGNKPLALLVASIDQAMSLASFTDQALDLADEHWPGGLTLVLPRLAGAPDWLGDTARRTIGLRCPDHDVALELLEKAGPLAVTSANTTGGAAAVDDGEAEDIFGDEIAVYLEGEAPGGQASTIIDLTEPSPLVLRRGPV
jgi:L-threonylcarbamoyladenylate synthase